MENITAEKVIVSLSQCVPGMVLMQPIVDIDTGNIIIAKGQMLTQELIKKIANFTHTQVWVDMNTEEKVWQVEEEVLTYYKQYVQMLKGIIGQKNKKLTIKLGELISLVDCIIEEFTQEFKLLACVNLLNKLDRDSYEHSINVAFLSLVIGRWENYSKDKLKKLVLASLLHDVGKIDVPMYILSKEIDMSIKEKLQYKRHPIYGYEKLSRYNEVDVEVLKAVLTHHERCDGSGFPLNLTSERISDLAKIIGIVDEYDRLRGQYHIFDVIKILRGDMIKKFDINLLLAFCNNIMNYYIGTYVQLNTGEIAEVVCIQSHVLHRPIVKVKERFIDLYDNPQIKIIKVY